MQGAVQRAQQAQHQPVTCLPPFCSDRHPHCGQPLAPQHHAAGSLGLPGGVPLCWGSCEPLQLSTALRSVSAAHCSGASSAQPGFLPPSPCSFTLPSQYLQGFVVSDCESIEALWAPEKHAWAGSPAQGAAAALNAGTDLGCYLLGSYLGESLAKVG